MNREEMYAFAVYADVFCFKQARHFLTIVSSIVMETFTLFPSLLLIIFVAFLLEKKPYA